MDMKINPQELTQRIADRIEGSRTDAERFVQSLFEIVEESLLADKIVRIKGIGTFKLVEVNARTSVDVNTKERIEIKEHFRVTFTPDAVLKDKVNKPFGGFTSVVLDECNVDTGVLENTEDDPLMDEQLTAYEAAGKASVPELNIRVEIPTEGAIKPEEKEPDSEETSSENSNSMEGDDDSVQEIPPVNQDDSTMGENQEDVSRTEEDEDSLTSSEDETFNQTTIESENVVSEETQTSDSSVIVSDESEQTSENSESDNPLNTKDISSDEEKGSGSSLTRILLIILLILLILACGMMGYFAYKLYYPSGSEQLKSDSVATVSQTSPVPIEKADTLKAPVEEEAEDSLYDNFDSGSIDLQMRAEIMKQELSSYYPQMEGGEYLIVGTADTVEVVKGFSLTKLSKNYFGSGDFVSYIKFYNRIDNPDLLREGQKLLIPLLTKK
jgi:nucleoid DNA-binding protein/flagellar basal body-associated protein FliL